MIKGNQSVEVITPCLFVINCDEEFRLYGKRDEETYILGPQNATHRFLRLRLVDKYTQVSVKTKGQWDYEITQLSDGREIPDPTPVEVSIEAPLTLREEMKRYIRTELSRTAEQDHQETFEEANDFEIDEDETLHSPYELHDMVEQYPLGEPDASESRTDDQGDPLEPSSSTPPAEPPEPSAAPTEDNPGNIRTPVE